MSTSLTQRRTAVPVTVLLVVLLAAVVLAIGLGPAPVAPADTARYLWAALTGGRIPASELSQYQIIWQVRTPRVLLAALVGAALSLVGVAIQAMVRNALADPFVLGISSGASVGAVTVSVSGGLAAFGVHAVSAGAFLGALGASALVYAVSGSASPLRLVLTGVALALGFQAVLSVIIYLVPDGEATATVLYWTMGGVGGATWGSLPVLAVVFVLAYGLLHRRSRSLDVLSLGDETAAGLGVDGVVLRRILYVLTAVLTGAAVAVSGAVGFVGLVIPHLVRLLAGSGHARVLAIAPPLGAVFLVCADLVSRTLVAPRELPLGVVTALVGVPVFVFLLRRRGYLFGGR
ncbi:FecCD family ABC transporter permease [Amycolatopsis suaedae]|uniref:Iron ABC transporter permease n=1 Tax=Amycolatopsis suaedae TaxID=2510978 RepID=A0A4Q7J821_9PSEU|nr:iron ABC transporter permease [Amycolatopsis suaedae]RZQ63830.1 iron ABC transporter permease [Amycolatopsis suaedae]